MNAPVLHARPPRRRRCHTALVTLAAITAIAVSGLVRPQDLEPSTPYRAEVDSVPVNEGYGHAEFILARVCRPRGERTARLVVINHGTPARSDDRFKLTVGRCEQEASRWFLDRGYVVALPLRRGYGAGAGTQADSSGDCPYPNFIRAGVETARDIDATVRYVMMRPFVRPEGAIVVGHSAGGWGAIAYDAITHPHVAAFVVMAGGRGGHYQDRPYNNCRPDLLVESAARFGRTATTPMLWIYTANDSFFDPYLARSMWKAFTSSGAQAQLQQLGPFDGDGHQLFFAAGGSAIWGPIVARYLQARGLAP